MALILISESEGQHILMGMTLQSCLLESGNG